MRHKNLEDLLDQYIFQAGLNKYGPGLIFSIQVHEKIEHECCVGKEINSHTTFPLASLSKHIIGSAFLELFQTQEASPNQGIEKYFPKFKSMDSITILDLLNHTSGIPEYLYLPTEVQLNTWSLSQYCNFIERLERKPRGNSLYSNSNYVLLTKILETISGKPYNQYLRQTVFNPLHMNKTFCFEDIIIENRAFAQQNAWKNKNWTPINLQRAYFGFGDSALFSSCFDLHQWVRTKRFKYFLANHGDYFAGMRSADINGNIAYFHSGLTVGASSLLLFIPELDYSLVLLMNHENNTSIDLIPEILGFFGLNEE